MVADIPVRRRASPTGKEEADSNVVAIQAKLPLAENEELERFLREHGRIYKGDYIRWAVMKAVRDKRLPEFQEDENDR